MTDTNKELTRANKLSVRPDGDHFIADFYRTHAKIATISSADTAWAPIDADGNKSAKREDFRQWIAQHSNTIGIQYDPEDRRTDINKRMAHYTSNDDIATDIINMVDPDIEQLIAKMPHADLIANHAISLDDVQPMTTTGKGTDLSTMGVIDGKYEKTGYWAWANLEVTITMLTIDGQEVYYPVNMQLVSGQLKKAHITQTAWNTQTHASLIEIGLVKDEAEDTKTKAEDTSKTETPTDDQPEVKEAKKTRKSSKKGDKAE